MISMNTSLFYHILLIYAKKRICHYKKRGYPRIFRAPLLIPFKIKSINLPFLFFLV